MLGASNGSARVAASAYGYARQQSPGVPAVPGPAIRAFPGTQLAVGSPEFLIWAFFVGSLVYMLGMHWLLGSARHVVG
jgi:hypothetical protein